MNVKLQTKPLNWAKLDPNEKYVFPLPTVEKLDALSGISDHI
jgi:hypothetical protein